MNQFSYQLSDLEIQRRLGKFIRHQRLEQNYSQTVLAQKAGISRSTLSLLESGETTTIATFIRVLRILEQLELLNAFSVSDILSPLKLAKLQSQKRQRASKQTQLPN